MSEPIDQLIVEIHKVIDRYRQEADLSYAETIGALSIIHSDLLQEEREEREED